MVLLNILSADVTDIYRPKNNAIAFVTIDENSTTTSLIPGILNKNCNRNNVVSKILIESC